MFPVLYENNISYKEINEMDTIDCTKVYLSLKEANLFNNAVQEFSFFESELREGKYSVTPLDSKGNPVKQEPLSPLAVKYRAELVLAKYKEKYEENSN